MKEIWKQLEKYPNYEISNFGKVRNIKTNRILKNRKNTSGLLQCRLGQSCKGLLVGRMVYSTFVMPLTNENVVFFPDGNKENVSISNMIAFENISKLKSYLLQTEYNQNPMKNSLTVKKQLKTRNENSKANN